MAEQTKPVDVLAALDEHIRFAVHGVPRRPSINEMREWRAALAELIDADVEYDKALNDWNIVEHANPVTLPLGASVRIATKLHASAERRAAALAAVRGGA